MATVKKQVVLPEEMDKEISRVASENDTTQSEIVRKALTLFLFAAEKKKQGLKLGFAKQDQPLEMEIIGI